MCLTGGAGAELTPQRIPEVLCLCDLSLLENTNIQMCLLHKPGQTKGRRLLNTANRRPFAIPGGLLKFNLCRFQPEQIKERWMQFCCGSAGIIPLSPLSSQHASQRTLGKRGLFPQLLG